MRFRLRIDTDNQAMRDAYAVAEALRQVADALDDSGTLGPALGASAVSTGARKVLDRNGNVVGMWSFSIRGGE